MTDKYKPISCDLHSQYELWIMRGQEIKLVWQDGFGITRIERVMPIDVRAETGNEYLYFEDRSSVQQRIRLDYIRRAKPISRLGA